MPKIGQQRFRHELKYVMPLSDADGFFKDIEPYCDLDKYSGATGSYEIASIYYDTDSLRFYFDREESVGYRRKIRLRAYVSDHTATALFVEIKEKHQNFVSKKRINLTSMDILNLGIPDIEIPLGVVLEELEDSEAAREMVYLQKRLALYPVVIIRYHRKALIPKFEDDMRITLDTNITAGGQSLSKFDSDVEKLVIAPDCGVLEVKSNQSVPLWLQSTLVKYGMSQCRYSKYCLGVDRIFGKGPEKQWVPVRHEQDVLLERLRQRSDREDQGSEDQHSETDGAQKLKAKDEPCARVNG